MLCDRHRKNGVIASIHRHPVDKRHLSFSHESIGHHYRTAPRGESRVPAKPPPDPIRPGPTHCESSVHHLAWIPSQPPRLRARVSVFLSRTVFSMRLLTPRWMPATSANRSRRWTTPHPFKASANSTENVSCGPSVRLSHSACLRCDPHGGGMPIRGIVGFAMKFEESGTANPANPANVQNGIKQWCDASAMTLKDSPDSFDSWCLNF